MAFRNKANTRDFKKGIDALDSRRKRADVSVQLRKKTREEQLMKRRMTVNTENNENANTENNQNIQNQGTTQISTANQKLSAADIQAKLKELPILVQKVNSDDQQQQLEGVTEFRKLLSIEKNPPIQEVINTGVVPRLVHMLSFTHHETLQFEAAWTLTNIASGTTEHTQHLIDNGGIRSFVCLLASPNADVKEQAVWALGNIAGDSPKLRDLVTQAGGVNNLLSVFTNDAKIALIRNATWTMSNLCRGKPQPDFNNVKAFLPVLAKLISFDDVEVLTDACWALSYLSDDSTDSNEKIQAVCASGVIPRLVQCLHHHHTNVQVPALRCIGNIVTGDDAQTNTVLQCQPLPSLVGLMSHRKKTIRKEACWTISNITAGTAQQIQTVIDSNCIPPLISLLKEDEFDIQKEATWAISNATSGGSSEQMHFLVEQGAIPALCELFQCQDAKIITVALEGIDNLLKMSKKESQEGGETEDEWCGMVEECGGLDYLEALQSHSNQDVYNKTSYILTTYFEGEEEDDEEQAPDMDASGSQFTFGDGSSTMASGFSF